MTQIGYQPDAKASLNPKRAATALAVVFSMIPVLIVGSATYYFGSQAIERQIIEARRTGVIDLGEAEWRTQRQQLIALSIGTGAIALLAGVIVALWMRKTLNSKSFNVLRTEEEFRQARLTHNQALTDVIYRVRASLKREDILRTAVEETRRALTTDRVVVYGVNEESQGVIIAESVDPRYPQILGSTITDPCFDAKYVELYEAGRVRALDDIYESGMTDCYIEQLEKIEVKANLVAPLLNEGKILGLLVAHQCSAPRVWQEAEIDLLTQIATQVGFALDNAKLLADYSEQKALGGNEDWWTELFMDISQRIHKADSEEEILDAAVREVRRAIGSDRVIVYALDQDRQGVVIAESVEPGFPRAMNKVIDDPCFASDYIDKYQNGRIHATSNIHEAKLTPCHIGQLESFAVKANLVAPILNQGQILGLLIAHQCSRPRSWKPIEIRWFGQMALQIGFAIDNVNLSVQADTENRFAELFEKTTQEIHANLSAEDVLKSAVEEVRNVLKCDRAVVYGMDRQAQGLIIAESVGSRWTRILGRVIEDPCFESRYISLYEDGRVRALNDIRDSNMTPCYKEQLESIDVRANLVAPVIHEGKLLGLLVAHQCSGPRNWTQLEIQWFTQIAVQVGFALDNAKLVELVGQMSQDSQVISLARLQEQGQLTQLLQEAGLQAQQTDETALTGHELISQTLEEMSRVQSNISNVIQKLDHLSQASPNLLRVTNFINKLAAQMNQQAMNLAIKVGQAEEVDQSAVIEMTETVRSAAEQLTAATTELEPLISKVHDNSKSASTDIASSSERIQSTTGLLHDTQAQISKLASFSAKLNQLVGELSPHESQAESVASVIPDE